jgi:hypothetical protein
MLSLEELTNSVEAGDVDTVVVAFTDMQGRLMGKRMEAHFFLEEMEHNNPIEGCNYLLALEMEMDPVPGYEIFPWSPISRRCAGFPGWRGPRWSCATSHGMTAPLSDPHRARC